MRPCLFLLAGPRLPHVTRPATPSQRHTPGNVHHFASTTSSLASDARRFSPSQALGGLKSGLLQCARPPKRRAALSWWPRASACRHSVLNAELNTCSLQRAKAAEFAKAIAPSHRYPNRHIRYHTLQPQPYRTPGSTPDRHWPYRSWGLPPISLFAVPKCAPRGMQCLGRGLTGTP